MRATYALHLLGLNALVIARPYFQPLEDDPAALVRHGATPGLILVFALIVLLALPTVMVALEWVAGLASARLARAMHLVFVAAFVALFVKHLGREAEVSGAVTSVAALLLAALAAAAVLRSRVVRSWLTVLGAAPVVVLILFVVVSPVRVLVFAGDGPAPVRAAGSGAPVVMIVLDELPVVSLLDARRRIDATRYPAFARLARTATWYREAKTVADHTDDAVPALLTGRRPGPDELPVSSDHPDSLFRLLGGTYRLDVADNWVDLCAPATCPQRVQASFTHRLRRLLTTTVGTLPVLPEGLRARAARRLRPDAVAADPAPGPQGRSVRRNVTAPDAPLAARFIRALGPARERTLNYVHLLLPHTPWVHLPDGRRHRPGPAPVTADGRRPRDPRVVATLLREHLEETGYADRVLGRVLDRLDELGTFDASLVVVVADHGASFIPGKEARAATAENLGGIAGVPLLIKAPGQRNGRVDDTPLETTDVLPTIAAELGVRIPWRVDGRAAAEVPDRRALTVVRDDGPPLTVRRIRLGELEAEALRSTLDP